jgi:hypothetical protein
MGFFLRYATREVILSNVERRCSQKGKGKECGKEFDEQRQNNVRVAEEKKITGKEYG